VDHRAGLDKMQSIKSCSYRDSNCDPSDIQPAAVPTALFELPSHLIPMLGMRRAAPPLPPSVTWCLVKMRTTVHSPLALPCTRVQARRCSMELSAGILVYVAQPLTAKRVVSSVVGRLNHTLCPFLTCGLSELHDVAWSLRAQGLPQLARATPGLHTNPPCPTDSLAVRKYNTSSA
jgi:hypothetical protein